MFIPDLFDYRVLSRLRLEYDEFNRARFGGALRSAVLELSDSESRLGCWKLGSRTIEISRSLVKTQPWPVVIEVLKHEMAHQYVHEVMRIVHETPHGPAFRDVCKKLGIDSSAAGVPATGENSNGPAQRLYEKVQRLLALAQSENRHEAELAMARAHEIMVKHNLSLLHQPDFHTRILGSANQRRTAAQSLIVSLLTEYFFVEAIFVQSWDPVSDRTGLVAEICGSLENVLMAEYVYEFLNRACERLWDEAKRGGGLKGVADKNAYMAGVVRGFSDTLKAQRVSMAKESATAAGKPAPPRKSSASSALVWAGAAPLADFMKRRYPRTTSTRTQTRGGEAMNRGRADGAKVVLNKPVAGSSGSSGKALPGKS